MYVSLVRGAPRRNRACCTFRARCYRRWLTRLIPGTSWKSRRLCERTGHPYASAHAAIHASLAGNVRPGIPVWTRAHMRPTASSYGRTRYRSSLNWSCSSLARSHRAANAPLYNSAIVTKQTAGMNPTRSGSYKSARESPRQKKENTSVSTSLTSGLLSPPDAKLIYPARRQSPSW